MRIEKGKYALYSDAYSYWINEIKISKNGKAREEKVAGYCTSLDKLIRDFSERVMRSSDAEDLEGVLTALRSAETACEALLMEVAQRGERSDDI